MDSVYVPLTLKYRPNRLSDLVGQPVVARVLRGMGISGRLVKTYLIYGPYGCGKTTLARLIALRVNCRNPDKKGEACLECASCKYIVENRRHPDITEMNAASERGIDDMRNMAEIAVLSPTFSRRVFILDEAHMLTGPAAQSLLKILEEPPPKTLFMLVTSVPEHISGPIRSRCQDVEVRKVDEEDLVERMAYICKAESIKLPRKALLEIAKVADGRPRNAISTLEKLIVSVEGADVSPGDLKQLLPKIVKEVFIQQPEKLAEKYLEACARGDYLAFDIPSQVDRVDMFFATCVELLKHVYIANATRGKQRGSDFTKRFPVKDVSMLALMVGVIADTVPKLSFESSRETLASLATKITFKLMGICS